MGESNSNAGLRTHAKSPTTGALEFYHHYGNENLDDATVVTSAEADDLRDDAGVDQATFDTTAEGIVGTPGWYDFSTLSTADKTTARATCRYGCSLWTG